MALRANGRSADVAAQLLGTVQHLFVSGDYAEDLDRASGYP
jgi:hypothetical protein